MEFYSNFLEIKTLDIEKQYIFEMDPESNSKIPPFYPQQKTITDEKSKSAFILLNENNWFVNTSVISFLVGDEY